MSPRRLWAVIRKEIQHILRDRSTFFLVLLTPTVVLFIMAYALTVDIQNVPISVLDYDRSAASRELISQITSGDDLHLYSQASSLDDIENLLLHGNIKAALIIHPNFSRDLALMKGIELQIIIDGTEPESGGFALDHISRRIEQYATRSLSSQIESLNLTTDSLQPIDLRVRTWYNPSLKPRVALIPGLISLVLGIPAISVALTLAEEREHGTLEQLLASPVARVELLLGKMVPYILVGLANVVLIPLIAILWFKVPFNGSFLLFFGLSTIFLFAILGMGLVIGVFIPTQAAALALSFLLIFFPGFFLTGIFFPIVSMPEIIRLEALFLPGTHYAIITRGVFLPGVGLQVLWPYAVMLFALGVVFSLIATLFFRKKLA
jgi:ABC-2 type transport system permease protein